MTRHKCPKDQACDTKSAETQNIPSFMIISTCWLNICEILEQISQVVNEELGTIYFQNKNQTQNL